MQMWKSGGFLANVFGAGSAANLARAAGRVRGNVGARMGPAMAEALESRTMLDGDHPGLPGVFNPSGGDLLTLDSVTALNMSRRGRALTGPNQGVSGTIAAGDSGDFFRFVMPSTAGRTSDFVTVLADTQTGPTGTNLNSTLDTYVEVYQANATNNGYQLVTVGANNGVLSSSSVPTPDGWAGFVGTAGTTYFIRVRANPAPLAAGRTATGTYTLRVDAATLDYSVSTVPPANQPPDPATDVFGEGDAAGALAFRQDDVVYRVITPNTDEFDSVATVGAIADDAAVLDTHLDVYDSGNTAGVVATLASDLQAGRLTNAFAAFTVTKGTTYYVRVRSDEVNAGRPATGNYSLAIDLAALEIGVDQTTRLSAPDRADAAAPLAGSNAPQGASSRLYHFTAQGTGTSFITVVGTGAVAHSAERNPGGPGNYPSLFDPALHLYNEQGQEIAFIDDVNGFTPQLAVSLMGGQKYYILVEGFDRAVDGGFSVFIEANYTNSSVDDHVDSDPVNTVNFGNATPLVWGSPRLQTDADGNSVLDRSWFQVGSSRGRIYEPGDTDLFQFTPPLSTLDEYAGDAGGQGRALYVGGNYGNADRLNANALATGGRAAPNVGIWDSDDWWNAGPGQEGMGLDPAALSPLNVPTISAINGPIFAMTEWDPDGAGTQFGTVLVAGGQFTDFDGLLVNLAMRVFKPSENRFVWAPIPGLAFDQASDAVLALTVFDANEDTFPDLIVGGRFATVGGQAFNHLLQVSGNGSFMATRFNEGGAAGVPGTEVRALTVWDPPAPFTPGGGGGGTQNPDAPAGLYIGGLFSRLGVGQNGTAATTSTNIIRFGQTGIAAMPGVPNPPRFGAVGVVNGAVNALTVWNNPNPPNVAGFPMTVLVLGGAFTSATSIAAPPLTTALGNIAFFTNGPANGATPAAATPSFIAVPGGTPGPVNALSIWNFPDTTPGTDGMDEWLVIGSDAPPLVLGDPTAGSVRITNGQVALNQRFNAPVRALTVFTDDEFDVAGNETLYIGGDFTRADGFGDIPFNHVAKIDDQNHDLLFTPMPLKGGVDGLAPGEPGPTSVFALSSFDDNVAATWDRNERPASRVSILVTLPTDPATGATDSFLDSQIRVFDSTGTVIYFNPTIAPPFPNPSGSINPAATAGPGFNTAFVLPGLWGGEVYYIEVTGNSTGRYNISIVTDAVPPEVPDDGDGFYPDVNRGVFDVVDEGQWGIAPELDLNTSGDGRNFDLLTTVGRQAFNGWNFKRTPGSRGTGGIFRSERDFLAGIETVDDTDLYQFRASATGTVEVRLSTQGILDQFIQTTLTQTPAADFVFNDSGAFATTMQDNRQLSRRYNSPLDSLLKVFSNDFELLGSNDDSVATSGTFDQFQQGIYADRTQDQANGAPFLAHVFTQRDGRVLIPVVAGETYFIQVESAFRDLAATNPELVDWRRATGSYELLINNTQSSNGIDDFENFVPNQTLALSTGIPTDITTGDGNISGIIDNVQSGAFQNPDDTDLFSYIAVNRGTLRITVRATSTSLRPAVTILDEGGNQAAAATATAAGGSVTLTINSATQGGRFYIRVDGDGITEGSYDISVDGAGLVDDHVKEGLWGEASPLSLNAFLGQYTGSGILENSNDSDLFTFTAEQYEVASVTITGLDSSLDPSVYVWEINANGQDPMTRINEWRLVGANDDGAGIGNNSRAEFSVTAGRQYFIVVVGSDPDTHFGRYNLSVNVAATDDHPDFVDFPLATQLDLSGTFNPLTGASSTSAAGNIEVNTDDDVFRFVAPATGRATVTVTTPNSGLAGNVVIYDAGQNILAQMVAVNGSASASINVSLNQQYYIRVLAGTTGADQPDQTGTYTVAVSTAPVDDFANEGQFMGTNPPVGVLTLSAATGVATLGGLVLPDPMVGGPDSDLFRFATLAAGNVQIRVTTGGSTFNPKIRVFDSSFNLIPGASSNGDTASLTFQATGAAQTYYILVSANDGATGAAAVGSYLVQIVGTRPGGGGGPTDDHANAGEFGDATLIAVDPRTGFGSTTGVINFGGDTDLFKFVPRQLGRSGVQVRTPSGGLVDGRIRVFDRNFVQIGEDAAGIPGATAAFNFNVTGNPNLDIYYILVEPIGGATGSYVIDITSQPTTHFLYFPEGFSGSTIDEFLPIVNPNSVDVSYSIFVRYEAGAQRTTPIATGVIRANSRGGVTISTKTGASLVDRGRPYALEIQSNGQLGATLSHYDFNVSVGEAFTNRLSTTWTFAQVDKDRNVYRDFMLFYNPNTTDANLSITLTYSDGTISTIQQTVPALRRGGIAFDNDSRILRNGRFGVQVNSSVGIVASLSVYNLSNSGGDGLLGDPDGGTVAGVIPNVSTGGGVSSELSFLNTNSSPVTVTITASYARVDLPNLVRVISLPANRQFSTTLAALGLINGQTAGLKYTATAPVTASVIEYQNGDGNLTQAATVAAREYTFGDLFVNPAFAGITYRERLGLFNPSATAIDVTIKFLFEDGTSTNLIVNVAAGNFGFVQIDQQNAILSRGTPTAFSLDVTSQTPIVASLTHYDLFLNGGWSTLGSPIGLTNAISTLI